MQWLTLSSIFQRTTAEPRDSSAQKNGPYEPKPETAPYNQLRLNYEENLNRPITSKEIEPVIKNLPIKVQYQMASLENSTKYFEN